MNKGEVNGVGFVTVIQGSEAKGYMLTNKLILCYVWLQQSMKEEESNSLYLSTLKLALQALCLLLPRFCADIMSHPRGCISDATMSVMRMPKPGRA